MPWLPLYADRDDLAALVAWLDDEPAIAYVVADDRLRWRLAGRRRWRVVDRLGLLGDPRIALWHTAGGPLTVSDEHGATRAIADPRRGWTEWRPGNDPRVPYFGPGHPAVIWLHTRPGDSTGAIAMSGFEWIGDRYRSLGHGASAATRGWWRRLGRHVRARAEKVPRADGLEPEIWALPGALAAIRAGTPRAMNP